VNRMAEKTFEMKCFVFNGCVCVYGCSLLKAIRHAVSRYVFSELPSSSSEDSDQDSQFCFVSVIKCTQCAVISILMESTE